MTHRVYIGWDEREVDAYKVAHRSILSLASQPVQIEPIALPELRERRLYWRKHIEYLEPGYPPYLYDVISGARQSTAFAISRFLTPILARRQGWALFMDCDVMARADICELFDQANPDYAVQVVKHSIMPECEKMDGQAQQYYPRKAWSSVVLWNCGHRANQALTPDLINTAPGRELHAFCWLPDRLIGALDPRWNHLVGVDPHDKNCKLAHFTLGHPGLTGFENSPFADEWRRYL